MARRDRRRLNSLRAKDGRLLSAEALIVSFDFDEVWFRDYDVDVIKNKIVSSREG